MNEDWWEEYVSSRGLDLLQLRDGRYDQVLHLVIHLYFCNSVNTYNYL